MENDVLDSFELWWHNEVESYAVEVNLPLHYVEEEMIIDGELIKVYPPKVK